MYQLNVYGTGAKYSHFVFRVKNVTFVAKTTHRTGRRFRTKLMSRYIGSSPNGQFDVRFEERVSKAENPGGFLRKNVF